MNIMEAPIVQANPLIESQKEMNVTELRIFNLGLARLQPYTVDGVDHDTKLHDVVISPAELAEIFGGNTGNIANLKRQLKRVTQRATLTLHYKNGGISFTQIYKRVHYQPEKGLVIQYSDDEDITKYMLNLAQDHYTTYKLKETFPLSSEYGWRIMELLQEKKGHLKKGNEKVFADVSMEDLRFYLNVPEKAYKGRIDNFKKFVLDIPIEEINEKTDYKVWYEIKKQGRRVAGFILWMKPKNKQEKEEAEKAGEERTEQELKAALEIEEVKMLADCGVNVAVAKIYFEKYQKYPGRITRNVKYAIENREGKTSFPGFVLSCIDKDAALGQDLFDQMTEEEHAEVQQHHIKKIHEQAKSGADEVVIEHEIEMSEETHQKVLKHLEKLRGN